MSLPMTARTEDDALLHLHPEFLPRVAVSHHLGDFHLLLGGLTVVQDEPVDIPVASA